MRLRRLGPGEVTAVTVALVSIAAFAIAQGPRSGEDTVVLIGSFALALLTVGVVWPVLTVAGVRVEATAPRDVVVGDSVPVHVAVHGSARGLRLRLLDPAGPWLRCDAPGAGIIAHSAPRRGVFTRLRVELRATGPVGAFRRRRVVVVRLAVPVTVAPRPVAQRWEPTGLPAELAAQAPATPGAPAGDTVRAVRPYVAGDPARFVHWPSSARRGELVVRELEPPAVTGVAIVVDLRGDPDAAEEAAGRACGLARAALAAGGRVLLATCEAGGGVVGPVTGPLEIGRRLARAEPGPPPDVPDWPVVRVAAR